MTLHELRSYLRRVRGGEDMAYAGWDERSLKREIRRREVRRTQRTKGKLPQGRSRASRGEGKVK
jgi:hypothetical protein